MIAQAPRSAAPPLRVLFIVFEFPPLTTGGVFRSLGFAEHLPSLGVELDIVTVRTDDYRAWSTAPLDEALAARVPDVVRVHRIPSGFPDWYWRALRSGVGAKMLQFAYWGDPVTIFWRRPLFAALDRLVAERRPDVLLATAPPFGVSTLACDAARRYRLPLVMDWRDPWTLWRPMPFPSYAHYRFTRAREGAALRDANVSVATSHVTRDDWLRLFPSADPSRLVTIYNGFDREVVEAIPRAAASDDPRRRIVHVGNFYYTPQERRHHAQSVWRQAPHRWLFYRPRREDWLYKSPYFFLRGLRRLADRDAAMLADLRVIFAGPVPAWLPAMLEETGTTGLVESPGWLPHREAAQLARTADALLLTSARVVRGRDYSVYGKTFEYIGLERPILGVLTDGATRDIVDRSGLGILADPDDPDAVADAIAAVVTAPRGTRLRVADPAFVRACDRRAGASRMATVLRRAAVEGYRLTAATPTVGVRARDPRVHEARTGEARGDAGSARGPERPWDVALLEPLDDVARAGGC